MSAADDLRGIRLSLLQGRAGRLKAQVARRSLEPDESMNSRVSWSVDGIDPFVRERAEAAARRAGMSLNDWLNSTVGDPTPPNFREPPGSVADAAEPGNPRRRRYPPAARRNHPPDRTDLAPDAAQRRAPRRAGRRKAVERRHLASRRAAVADHQPAACQAGPASGRAAPDRVGRARGRPGLPSVAAAQSGLARLRDQGNRCAPERT